MKLQRAHEYVAAVAATIVGMAIAVFCGNLTGRGQTGVLLLIVGCCLTGALCLWLKQRIWILIPMFWTLTGQIRELPIPFAVRDVLVVIVFVISLVFIALKIIRGKPNYQLVDLFMGGILIYLLTTFLRNPVGVEALNSPRIGGKPYFNTFMACLAYWVLSRVSLGERDARTFPIVIGLGSVINSVLSAITFNFPVLAPWMSRFYSGVHVETLMSEGYLPEEMRQTYLSGATIPLLGLFSYFRPLRVINPMVLYLFVPTVLCSIAVMLSGYRSLVLAMVIYFCIASYVRTGWRDIIRCLVIGIPLLGMLILAQGRVVNLPLNIQRSLSFLPGRWSYTALAQAQSSTQWRIEMWKTVLTEDKYINNFWFGDGFGFSRREYEIMQRMSVTTEISGDQESVMIMGGVHSGPISTIRCLGVIGLLGYIVFLTLFARYAWRLIRQSQKTAFFPMALFLCIPIVWEPFNFIFIFGAFDVSLPNSILTLGLLNMLRNSLEWMPAAVAANNGRGPQSTLRSRHPKREELAGDELLPVPFRGGPLWQPRRS